MATSAVLAAEDSRRRTFPLRATGADSTRGITLEVDADRFVDLAGRATVRLESVPLPEVGTVDLDLTRMHILRPDSIVAVDGVARPAADLESLVSLWRGKVAGEEDSWAFMAFSPYGSRGVIRRRGELYRMGAAPARMATGAGPSR